MRYVRGFSLIELMVVVGIIGVLLAFGLPSMTQYLQNARIRTVASELRDGMMTARMEAIRRNTTVTIALSGPGWAIATMNRTRTPTKSESNYAVNFKAAVADTPTDVTTLATHDITFGGDGRVTAGSGFLHIYPKESESSCKVNGGEVACLRVNIGAGGIVRMCNSGLTLANDPQGC